MNVRISENRYCGEEAELGCVGGCKRKFLRTVEPVLRKAFIATDFNDTNCGLLSKKRSGGEERQG